MNVPFGWRIPVVIAGATAIALWAGRNLEIALPAAVVAVGASALLVLEVWGLPAATRPTARLLGENPRVSVRDLFRSGRLGREEIVELLDRLERSGPDPFLPGKTPEELDRIARLPRAEFREYLRARIADLEGRT